MNTVSLPMRREILFPEYRDFFKRHTDTNNAMMAVLVGANIAGNTLLLTQGSSMTLAQIFPSVKHIGRFNFKNDTAREYLGNAEKHIAAVAIPYALATYEAFADEMKAYARHHTEKEKRKQGTIFDICEYHAKQDYLEIYQIIKLVRNCIMHNDQKDKRGEIEKAISAMSNGSRQQWKKMDLNREPESILDQENIILDAQLIFATFAITKEMAREINEALASHISEHEWAKIAVKDFATQTRKTKNSSAWKRALFGYTHQYYALLELREEDLLTAARELHYLTK